MACVIALYSGVAAAMPHQTADSITTADADSVTTLHNLEVTADRRHLATVQTLDGKELQALSSTSIADALKYFAGVQIKDYGGLGGLKTLSLIHI